MQHSNKAFNSNPFVGLAFSLTSFKTDHGLICEALSKVGMEHPVIQQ